MVRMTFIWWIYHFWARFWPYFNFVDFRAYFGPFSLVNRDQQKMADFIMKMASNKRMQENKPTLKLNFTMEKRWGVSKFSFWHSHWALTRIYPHSLQIKMICFLTPAYIIYDICQNTDDKTQSGSASISNKSHVSHNHWGVTIFMIWEHHTRQ